MHANTLSAYLYSLFPVEKLLIYYYTILFSFCARCMASCYGSIDIDIDIYYYYITLYLSAHVQCTKQALGIAPHEALFKKNKHTKKFTETLQRIVNRHTNLFFHIFLIAIPTPLSLHAPSKIIANFPSSSAASNFPLSGCPSYQFFPLILPSCAL